MRREDEGKEYCSSEQGGSGKEVMSERWDSYPMNE